VRNRTRNARSASYAAFVGVRNLLWDIRVKDAGRPHTVFTDAQGNVVPGATAESSALFAQALHAFNIYRGDPVALVDRAIAAAPGCAMSHLLKTYLLALATEPAATAAASETLAAARALPLDERAASHAATLTLLLDGEWTAAAVALDRHNASYPRDLLGLQCGHLMDFYRANARNLRDRIARVLPHWSPDVPGYPVVLGMYAFGLEESGAYARAEDTGREAVDREPLDCWAHHAVAHVMEMQGRAQDGIGWMSLASPSGPVTTTSSRCTTGGISRSTTWIWVMPRARSRSTTAACARVAAPSRSTWSTPRRCCGASPSSAMT